MTAEELITWEIFYSIDPWGEERADLRNGILCTLTDACHRTRGQPKPPLHYMPIVKDLTDDEGQQTEEQMKAIWAQAAAGMGGK